MGKAIAIVGKPGTGKSTSFCNIPELGIKGLDPKETFVININILKGLPMKNWQKYYVDIKEDSNGNFIVTKNSETIIKVINYVNTERKEIKNIVIDDAQYIMAYQYMARAKENGYNKFVDIGVSMSNIIDTVANTRKDLLVFFLWHPENDKEYGLKMKTIGAMLDSYLTLEGLFDPILYSRVVTGEDNKPLYQFVTKNDGSYPARSTYGMFEETYIHNDLSYVREKILVYEGLIDK